MFHHNTVCWPVLVPRQPDWLLLKQLRLNVSHDFIGLKMAEQRVYDPSAHDSQVEIAKIVGSRWALSGAFNMPELGKTPNRVPGSGGHNKKRDEAFLNSLKAKVAADRTVTIRRPAKNFNMSNCTIRLAIKEGLGLKSFLRTRRHLLTISSKEKRFERCCKILGYFQHQGSTVKMFSYKKIFTVDQVPNMESDHLACQCFCDKDFVSHRGGWAIPTSAQLCQVK